MQSYLNTISRHIETLLCAFACEYSTNCTDVHTDYTSGINIIQPDPVMYKLFLHVLLSRNPRHFQEQTNEISEEFEILRSGNARERCMLFARLVKNSGKFTLLNWLLTTDIHNIPTCVNYNEILTFGNLFKKPMFEITKRECILYIREIHHKNNMLYRVIAPFSRSTQKKTRQMRSNRNDACFLLDAHTMVPRLSCRERMKLSKEQQNVIVDTGKLPWGTGRMKWQMREENKFVTMSRTNNQELIAGVSGHSEYIYFLTGLLSDYSLELTTLINCLWLVPCEHHSLYEILVTSNKYGLKYNTRKNPLLFVDELLHRIERHEVTRA